MPTSHLGFGSSLAQRARSIHLDLDARRVAVDHCCSNPLPVASGDSIQRDLVAVLRRSIPLLPLKLVLSGAIVVQSAR